MMRFKNFFQTLIFCNVLHLYINILAMSVFLDGSDDDLHGGELAVDAQAQQHQEEDDRPNLADIVLLYRYKQ